MAKNPQRHREVTCKTCPRYSQWLVQNVVCKALCFSRLKAFASFTRQGGVKSDLCSLGYQFSDTQIFKYLWFLIIHGGCWSRPAALVIFFQRNWECRRKTRRSGSGDGVQHVLPFHRVKTSVEYYLDLGVRECIQFPHYRESRLSNEAHKFLTQLRKRHWCLWRAPEEDPIWISAGIQETEDNEKKNVPLYSPFSLPKTYARRFICCSGQHPYVTLTSFL